MGSRVKDLTGHRFGKLKVIERAENKNGRIAWLCECDCGNKKIILSGNLTTKKATSCGCYRIEQTKKINRTHGETKTRLYRIWKNMRDRCYRHGNINFKKYGEKGIIVCDIWRKSYINFREWALSNGYADNLTIDRIDNNGNYCPENCRWVTQKAQQRNRRNNHLILGKTLSEWEDLTGINQKAILKRLNRGWTEQKAITTPIKH